MAALTTIKLTNRSPKLLKRLPESIEVPAGANIEDVKKIIAREANVGDFNRLGLSSPETKKLLKDRKALVADIDAVAKSGELLVKDLGPQISWRGVFVLEYVGPILIHLAVLAARPYIYPGGDAPLSSTQWLSFYMIIAHFVKREIETLFVHKFSANTMPVRNIFKNCAFYWALSGFVCAVSIYYPGSLAARADEPLIDYAGLALYLFGEISNAAVHLYLASLRSTGGTERKIPHGYGFAIVTCPNYMYEILAWVGIIIASRDWSVALFIAIGAGQMYFWSKDKEAAYRKEFGDKYKKKRFGILPGIC
ncbi:Putative 3-oxo-5-alpha-steroid 4-dehydrogenase [[Torrubiella] hemipterigena]|uniref:very-long-chain enoyl-CoA reductase n=1 Tax=[Torrubiella] hemipterigena TaxID=1531966 RepID=A0A0A1T7V2_9HYPO|nr:Putative 3-oxo-5-alpha-steroid 4-dehydrogenase [[Torrubiella] hemipterigena]